ncbi:MAG: BglG family transcription antiterminator [Erysipelotrichaceae bacterium]|nr:BglG family transcription antiterminator [Erysipelotrichaceae bacterium]
MQLWSLDTRCTTMLNLLLTHHDYVSIVEVAKTLNVSRRSIYYDLNKINEWLETHQVSFIQVERSRGLILSSSQREKISELLTSDIEHVYYFLQPKERTQLILCSLLGQFEPVFVDYFCQICDVSRNTAFNDLKTVRQKLNKYELELIFEPHTGYRVDGSLIMQRALFLYYFEPIIPILQNRAIPGFHLLNFYDFEEVEQIMKQLKKVEERLHTNYVSGMIFSLSTLINNIIKRKESIVIDEVDAEEITQSQEFQLVKIHFPQLNSNEQIYLAMHLLGSRVQVPTKIEQTEDAIELARQLVTDFELLACINFDDKDQLISMIAHHLKMSIYRYKYGIQIGNPLMADIRTSYPDLFDLTVKAARGIKKKLGVPIPDAEIAYITMHFGGFLRQKNISVTSRILLVCPNGISTANMLKGEVESLHPNIEVVGIVPVEKIEQYLSSIDFIISTVDVNTTVPVIRVNPIISEEDRLRILSRVARSSTSKLKSNQITMEKIVKIVGQYLNDDQLERIILELQPLFGSFETGDRRKTMSIRLSDVLTPTRVQVLHKVKDWRSALTIASAPLIDEKVINESYIDAMIANVEYYGPYIVIAPYLALGHALPSDGVNALGVSVLKLEEDVFFEDRPVSVVMILAPIDKRSHLGIMKDIMDLFNDGQFVSDLSDYKMPQPIYELIVNRKKDEEDEVYGD